MSIREELLCLYRMTRSVALILSAIIIYFIIIKIYYLLDKTSQEKNVKSKFWMIYFFINFTILLFVWPGIFKGDEFYMMPVIMRMKIQWTQSLLTTLLYQIALMILPYLFSITLLQIIIISTIASEIYIRIYSFIENKRLANLLFIPFCLLPVLDNNQFTLRTSIISWLFVFLLVDAYIAVKELR